MSAATAFFADRAWHGTVEVAENVQLAESTYRLRFEAPEIARQILPGQFLMLRIAGSNDPLLGRPLALYDVALSSDGVPQGVDVVYLAIGKFTSQLAASRTGQRLEVWGPLGNGFPLVSTAHLIMVAGGIGQTPFLTLAQEQLRLRRFGDPPRNGSSVPRITLCYGVRRKSLSAGIPDFERAGVRVLLSSDDGSIGHHGFVTDVLLKLLAEDITDCRIVCCGPEPMMQSVTKIALAAGVPCQVSLETPMACGIGICFSCVTKVRDEPGGWDYRRTCVEGPVFAAEQIAW